MLISMVKLMLIWVVEIPYIYVLKSIEKFILYGWITIFRRKYLKPLKLVRIMLLGMICNLTSWIYPGNNKDTYLRFEHAIWVNTHYFNSFDKINISRLLFSTVSIHLWVRRDLPKPNSNERVLNRLRERNIYHISTNQVSSAKARRLEC